MELKNLALLDESLVKFLRKKYPPIEWTSESDRDSFLNDIIYRAGQRSVIDTIEHIIKLQKEGKRNG